MAVFIILLLILLNAYFSLAEIALVTVKQSQLASASDEGSAAAAQALRLVKDPEAFLSAVQVGITLLGLLEGIYGGDLVATRLQPVLERVGFRDWVAHITSVVLGIGTITYLTIVIGELLPKSVALQAPLKITLLIAPSLAVFSRIAFPFIKALTWSTRILLHVLRIKSDKQQQVSEADIRRMLSTAYQRGILKKEELWLHQNVLVFSELTAGRIMKPFALVRCVSAGWSKEQVAALMRQYPYTHFPVMRDGKLNGVLSIKTFSLADADAWEKLVKPPLTVPESMEAGHVFSRFKETKNDFAIVMNANEEPAGIVTMQDIMEGVFGDIPELETYSKFFFKVTDRQWQAHSFIHLQRIRRMLGLEWLRDYESKYLTLAELLEGVLGHVPVSGDVLTLRGVTFRMPSDNGKQILIDLSKANPQITGASTLVRK